MQPGQSINPNKGDSENTVQDEQPETAQQAPENQHVQSSQNQQQEESFVYTGNTTKEDSNNNGIHEISWQASEYISHQKTAAWYAAFVVAGIVLLAGLYILLNDIVSVVVIALGLITFVVYGSRKPGILQYRVDESGVTIDEKHYSFERFRSFAVSQDHGIPTVILYPTQRFLPPLSLYCAPNDFNQIAETISSFLPESEHKPDFIEKIMGRLRF